ncbi:hypothetical protein G6F23_015141 [Rhizopus arrhizus]|nr:hypothetical protein G6F23_015141 [Rhizopus arrhizus]
MAARTRILIRRPVPGGAFQRAAGQLLPGQRQCLAGLLGQMWCTIAQQAHQVGQAGRGQRRVLAYHQVDQRGGAPNGAGGAVVRGRVRGGLGDTRATVAPLDR